MQNSTNKKNRKNKTYVRVTITLSKANNKRFGKVKGETSNKINEALDFARINDSELKKFQLKKAVEIIG